MIPVNSFLGGDCHKRTARLSCCWRCFSALLRLVFGTMTLGNAPLLPSSISIDIHVGSSASTSSADFCACFCPPPLAAADADFTSNLLLGFGLSSNGVSPSSCEAGAGCDDDAGGVSLLPLLFGCRFSLPPRPTPHFSSLLFSAPCGVTLRHSSVRTLQRSEWMCARLLSLMALHPGHPAMAPNSSMSCFVLLQIGNGGLRIGSARTSGLSTVQSISKALQSHN